MAGDDRSNRGAILEDSKARVRRYVEEFQSGGNPGRPMRWSRPSSTTSSAKATRSEVGRHRMQRCSISAVGGYSAWSM
jgi:hypothetical protein